MCYVCIGRYAEALASLRCVAIVNGRHHLSLRFADVTTTAPLREGTAEEAVLPVTETSPDIRDNRNSEDCKEGRGSFPQTMPGARGKWRWLLRTPQMRDTLALLLVLWVHT